MSSELKGQGLMYYKDEATFTLINQNDIKTIDDLKNIWEELTGKELKTKL